MIGALGIRPYPGVDRLIRPDFTARLDLGTALVVECRLFDDFAGQPDTGTPVGAVLLVL
jgi:hypothetical protein